MVIRDLHIIGIGSAPFEANSVLIVDTDAVLALPIAVKLLQSVSGRGL
jgi:hypothetical protein